MKILFLTPRFPYPPLKGDQGVAYHRLRTLSSRHDITLLSLFERDEDLAGLPHLESLCAAVRTVRLPRWRSYLSMLARGPWSSTPLQLQYYRSASLRRALREVLAQGHFDLVHAFMLRLAPYLDQVGVPRVLELIDSMQLNMGRTAERASGIRRLVYEEERRRVAAYEQRAGSRAELLIFVSEADRATVPGARSVALPLGVAPGAQAAPGQPVQDPVVVFSGNMGYAPNVDAVTWFADQCWSRVRARCPSAQFWVAGAAPHPAVRALATRPGIRILGFVPDMFEVLQRARVAVAPMQSGSGMQNKVLEAMACAIPVVTTRLGLGTIEARPGEDLVVEDAPERFAAAIVELLGDPGRCQVIGRSGRALVAARHSWEAAAAKLEDLYADLVAGSREARGRAVAAPPPGDQGRASDR